MRLDHIVRQRLTEDAEGFRQKELTVHDRLDAAVAHGDPSLLGQLVGNLAENASKYNYPHGWILVTTCAEQSKAIIEISNSGPVLTDEELPGLLEPFRRANRQRVGNSTGLGLSIVRAIIEAHGGEFNLTAHHDGGLTVRAALPAAPKMEANRSPGLQGHR